MRAAALLTLLLLAPAASAQASCEGSTSASTLAAGPYYVVVEDGGVVVYDEANDHEGLQRSDDAHDDTCGEGDSDSSHGYLHVPPAPGKDPDAT